MASSNDERTAELNYNPMDLLVKHPFIILKRFKEYAILHQPRSQFALEFAKLGFELSEVVSCSFEGIVGHFEAFC